jgi:hypothetical protein
MEDDGYAQDLRDAVDADELAFRLVIGPVAPSDLAWMTPTEWQWFARWRQALGGRLDRSLLGHLSAAAGTRFARFEVRALVLRDPHTNLVAAEIGDRRGQHDDIGLNWLRAQADETRNPLEALELARDSLQCATEASWFVLRQLTSLGDDRADFVTGQLDAFAEQNGVTSEITWRWRSAR